MPQASGPVLIRGCGGLNCVIPKGMVQYSKLPAPVTFLGNGVFADVKGRTYWRRAGSDPMIGVLIGRGQCVQTHREDHVDTEAEARVVPPQIKSHQGNHSKLEEAKGSSPAFGGSVALPMP